MKKLLAAAAIAALAFTAHAQDKKPADKTVGAVGKASAVYVVEAIDAKAGKITVRGPQRTIDLSVKDAALLKTLKKDDMIEATFAEAVTIKVEKGMASPAAPAKK